MEDWIGIAVKAAGGALAGLLIWLVLRPTALAARKEAGRRYLETGKGLKIVCGLMLAVCCFILYALYASRPYRPGDEVAAYGVMAMTIFAVALFSYLLFIYRIAWDDNFIHLRTLRHWGRRIPWDAVRTVEYRDTWQAWHVKTADAGTIWIYHYQSGHAEFLEMARDRASRAARG